MGSGHPRATRIPCMPPKRACWEVGAQLKLHFLGNEGKQPLGRSRKKHGDRESVGNRAEFLVGKMENLWRWMVVTAA